METHTKLNLDSAKDFAPEFGMQEMGGARFVRDALGAERGWEAGPDGLEMLAFGAHAENDAEMQAGWWTDCGAGVSARAAVSARAR